MTKVSSLGTDCQIIRDNIDILSFCEKHYNAAFIPGTNGWYNTNCLMPDHIDSDPSFGVNTETNTFNCFSCGAKGSVIDLVMYAESMDLPQAVRFLLDYLDIQPTIASSKFHQIKKMLKQKSSRMNRDILLNAKLQIFKKNRLKDKDLYYKDICSLFKSYASDHEPDFIKTIYSID